MNPSKYAGLVTSSIFILLAAMISAPAQAATCGGTTGAPQILTTGDQTTDLDVTGPCEVRAGNYTFHNVNIYKKAGSDTAGTLTFVDADINFYAESILVENQGSLIAGTEQSPIGTNGGVLTIHLWGKQSDAGILCKGESLRCGVSTEVWNSNPAPPPMDRMPEPPASCESSNGTTLPKLPGEVSDCFYRYQTLDMSDETLPAYFGHKVLAVSFGGTLHLFGKKGATYAGSGSSARCADTDPSCSGTSWVRLKGSLTPTATSMTLDGVVDWADQDHIVLTSTDFLPGHAEELIIQGNPVVDSTGKTTTFHFANADGVTTGVKWPHNGIEYTYGSKVPTRLGLPQTSIETRAAVGLLSRSIKIVSEGDTAPVAPMFETTFPPEPTDGSVGYFFGGHTVVRQGFLSYQVQGVQFHQLGQGGSIMHYPVHFHMARMTPGAATTFVKDSSIDDSMTRWITIHATQGVLVARNVGYKSIGHGYYLEDGTETNNELYSNLGVFARAAVDNIQNPRKVPGILTATTPTEENPTAPGFNNFPYYSDSDRPAVFWIMNGWNDFEHNVAAGAGTCGACYWLVPSAISGPSQNQKWFGYAGEQLGLARAATTPLKTFLGNSCSSAMTAFTEVGNMSACLGVNNHISNASNLKMLGSEQAAKAYKYGPNGRQIDPYYWPRFADKGRTATRCPDADKGVADADCGKPEVQVCNSGTEENCDVTVLDNFTTSFNWEEKNFAAIWMRPFWSLVINSAVTDVLNGGINFVTSGDFSKSSVPTGFWALSRKTVNVGSTQWHNAQNPLLADNPLTSNAGPFNPFSSKTLAGPDGTAKLSGLKCGPDPISGAQNNSFCLSKDEGVSIQLDNWSTFQRFTSVYDGPTYQDSNAYLDILPTYLTSDGNVPNAGNTKLCKPDPLNGNPCANTGFMNSSVPGVKADRLNNGCYFPNAAIGWKQPNAFFYAPAFHSTNLFFDNVGIRHFVIEPLFKPGTFTSPLDQTKPTDPVRMANCYWSPAIYNAFTDIDRQTVLNDDDGTLTGLTSSLNPPHKTETISVNEQDFFDAPFETPECSSDLALNATADAKCPPNTAKTSPYEYLSAVVFPECALNVGGDGPLRMCNDAYANWGSNCENASGQSFGCAGVNIYRQLLTQGESPGLQQQLRMMGQNTFQRSALTTNHGSYYIDTTVSKTAQANQGAVSFSAFAARGKYDIFFLYSKPDTQQTYKLYVGAADPNYATTHVKFGYVNIDNEKYTFKEEGSGSLPEKWKADYKDGYLTLAIDMSGTGTSGLAKDFARTESMCQPRTMCSWNSRLNQCACNPASPYYSLCQERNANSDTICSWSVKDLDCPAKGCPGLQITFPDDFTPDDATDHHRPAPTAYTAQPDYKESWDVPFNLESKDIANEQCYYTSQPSALTCP
ncbi:MAG TPA: G8 domain-containing protein [Candidatus Binataceae bacterium]|nr:G8 domain-containing protein [Candidatus Binataceae bacterium]